MDEVDFNADLMTVVPFVPLLLPFIGCAPRGTLFCAPPEMDGWTHREREIRNNALVNFQNPHEREREFKILNDRFFQFTRLYKRKRYKNKQ